MDNVTQQPNAAMTPNGAKQERPQQVTILGSTGSIGTSTLAVLALHAKRFEVFAITANESVAKLYEQCLQFSPKYAVLRNQVAATNLRGRLAASGSSTEVLEGEGGLKQVASDDGVDTVMAAIVGSAGLSATMAAVKAGKKVLLANKESLVMAGSLFMQAVEESGATVLPIDSEHNAIFQCLPLFKRDQVSNVGRQSDSDQGRCSDAGLLSIGVKKILLTGSGGPFRTLPLDKFSEVTPEQACAHPNWDMGRKISVDSATMMNKGLELIEACWLFDCKPDMIDIIIHPQSVVHSMVEYQDGSVLAQLGFPDMRTPIAHALAWPDRMDSGVASLNWSELSQLSFEAPDSNRFPALSLAQSAASEGRNAPLVLNAANEVAVEAFLANRLRFDQIPVLVAELLEKIPSEEPQSFTDVEAMDIRARALAKEWLGEHC